MYATKRQNYKLSVQKIKKKFSDGLRVFLKFQNLFDKDAPYHRTQIVGPCSHWQNIEWKMEKTIKQNAAVRPPMEIPNTYTIVHAWFSDINNGNSSNNGHEEK